MKGYIGFKNGLINGEQKYIENTVIEDEAGIVFYRLPHHLVEHYDFAKDFEFAEVEALDEVHTDDNEKFVTTKLKIGKKISVAELCKRSVSEFFEAFEFDKKIEEAKQTANYGAANAGDYGTANAGDYGTANAGNCGVANAGDYGAANAGDCGVAIVRENGKASVKPGGAAVAFDGWAKGEIGAVLLLIETDDSSNIKHAKMLFVDGEIVKPDTYYRLEDGEVIEMEESK